MLTGKVKLYGIVKKLAGIWDIPVNDAKHKWGLCKHEWGACYGVPYALSYKLKSGQRQQIEKGMHEIERATCIR